MQNKVPYPANIGIKDELSVMTVLFLFPNNYFCISLIITVMNFSGLLVGLATFIIIGFFHPIVIKAEYCLGVKCWWMFAIAGIIFSVLSLVVSDVIFSTIFGVVAFSSFWSILELFQQRERVRKGWFPANPNKRKTTKSE